MAKLPRKEMTTKRARRKTALGSKINLAALALAIGTQAVASAASAQGVGQSGTREAPFNNQPTRLFNFETANVLPKGTLVLNVGTSQTDPSKGTGTGNQVYFGGGSYAVSDRLSFGIDFQSYRDPVFDPINGANPNFFLNDLAIWGKYQFINTGRWQVAALASVEQFVEFDADLWGGVQSGVMAGSLKIPVTFTASERLQFHVTPSVSVFPDTVGGAAFYGTVGSIGAGISYKPSERLAFYGAVDVAVSGGNTISNTAAFVQQPVWTVGGRYNVTPKIALDAFLTNGVGVTSATSNWTHWPDGDDLLAGLQLSWTPGARIDDSYRGMAEPVTARDVSLQQEGVTLETPNTLEPGVFAVRGWYGQNDAYGIGFAVSPDRDGEIDFVYEQYSNDGSVPASLIPKTQERYMIGPKLRFMDQNNGDPFSFAGRMLYGRHIEAGKGGVGVFYISTPASYDVNDTVTLTANPQIAAFGNTEVAGLGLGVNFELFNGFEVIAEATAVGLDATDPTWAAGVRYNLPNTGLSVDLSATNAIGRNGIGTMIAQDSTNFSLQLTKAFDLSGWR